MKKIWLLGIIIALLLSCCAVAVSEEAVVITTDVNELIIGVGEIADYKLSTRPASARRSGFTFTISDESIAKVTDHGLVQGVALGECVLTITSDYDPLVYKTLPVMVVQPVERLITRPSKTTVYVGETANIDVACYPITATMQEVTFTSSDIKVAEVDGRGEVVGVSKGKAIISVQSKDGKARSNIHMTVQQQPESIMLSASSTALLIGDQMMIKATILPRHTDNKKMIWSSSDESIATVSQLGQVMAISRGIVTITVKSEVLPELTASVVLTVNPAN